MYSGSWLQTSGMQGHKRQRFGHWYKSQELSYPTRFIFEFLILLKSDLRVKPRLQWVIVTDENYSKTFCRLTCNKILSNILLKKLKTIKWMVFFFYLYLSISLILVLIVSMKTQSTRNLLKIQKVVKCLVTKNLKMMRF